MMLHSLLGLPRAVKRAIALAIDIIALFLSFLLALFIQSEGVVWPVDGEAIVAVIIAIPFSLALFAKLGLYRAVVRYMPLSALLIICLGVLSSTVVLSLIVWFVNAPVPAPVIIIYALLSLVIVGGLRLLMRALFESRVSKVKDRVIIYGAGSAGRQLAQALMNGEEYHPVYFIDDDATLHRSSILGLLVNDRAALPVLIERCNVKRVLLAIPSATPEERKEILEYLEPMPVGVQTIPGMADVVDGTMAIDELQEVRVEDLLGRDPVKPRRSLMNRNILQKNVMVSGAGGSIGAELCRQIIVCEPTSLVLVESSEYNLYAIEKELRSFIASNGLTCDLVPLLCSIQNCSRLEKIMCLYQIDTVYHAAAFKHVPMVEYNIVEGVRNNVFGTLNAAQSAIAAGVSDFVLISTDKAVRPTNVMGATKRMAELVLQGLAHQSDHTTRFSMVRFGNVLGSSGSVVPLFRQQIIEGGPVTVTHPDITRYFMTIPEAAQLVIQAGAMGSFYAQELGTRGGDVFVLDMGEPVKIDTLARKLIRLMGLEVRDAEQSVGDIEIKYSGLRPGEKLYEELLIGDDVQITDHPRIMTAREIYIPWSELKESLDILDRMCSELEVSGIHELLKQLPLGFEPSSGINDLLWKTNK